MSRPSHVLGLGGEGFWFRHHLPYDRLGGVLGRKPYLHGDRGQYGGHAGRGEADGHCIGEGACRGVREVSRLRYRQLRCDCVRHPDRVLGSDLITAVPSEPPTCRVTSFIAEATPALSSGTAPITDSVAGPMIQPMFIATAKNQSPSDQ